MLNYPAAAAMPDVVVTVLTDIDGTLVARGRSISDRNRAAVDCLLGLGGNIVPASGRSIVRVRECFSQGWSMSVVGANGNCVAVAGDPGRVICPFSVEELETVSETEQREECTAIYSDYTGALFSSQDSARVRSILSAYGEPEVRMVSHSYITTHRPFFSHVHLVRPVAWVGVPLVPGLMAALSVPEFVTLTPSGIDKAVGVQAVAGDLLRRSAHIIAIGDGENDLSLFALATIKVSIGGGSPRLVELADVVAPTVHEDGFAWSMNNVVVPLMQAYS